MTRRRKPDYKLGRLSKKPFLGGERKAALTLFGLGSVLPGSGKRNYMESPEAREQLAQILRLSDKQKMQDLSIKLRLTLSEVRQTAAINHMGALNITLAELADELNLLMRQDGLIKQSLQISSIMEENAIAARDRTVTCSKCSGEGSIEIGSGEKVKKVCCPECYGEGQVVILGDNERLKLTLESTGVIKRNGGGLALNIDQRTMPASNETLHGLSQSIAGILEGEGRVKE